MEEFNLMRIDDALFSAMLAVKKAKTLTDLLEQMLGSVGEGAEFQTIIRQKYHLHILMLIDNLYAAQQSLQEAESLLTNEK